MDSEQRVAGTEVEATVVERLPRDMYRLLLDDHRVVLAHLTGSGQRNFVRLRDGDRVRVQLSPHDPTRGRIMKVLEKS